MSQMPDSVYLPNDSKYCTVGIFTAYNENYLLSENDFNEDCLDDYTEYTPMYRLEEEKQHLIEKAIITIKDIKLIDQIMLDLSNSYAIGNFDYEIGTDEFYEETLKRYNQLKNK